MVKLALVDILQALTNITVRHAQCFSLYFHHKNNVFTCEVVILVSDYIF